MSHAEQVVPSTQRRRPTLDEVLEALHEAVAVAAADPTKCARLADAGTTCALHVTDADRGVTMCFDRTPVALADTADPGAASRIWGPLEAWQAVFEKGNLGIAVARGQLEYEGPVREFLRVFPIVRTAYRDVVRGDHATPAAGTEEIW